MVDRRRFFLATVGAATSAFSLFGLVQATRRYLNKHVGEVRSPRPVKAIDPTNEVDNVVPKINPELRAHGAIFARKIYKVGDNVYSAVGWSGCNTIMVVGDSGVIIVDPGSDLKSAQEVATEFRSITDKPVRAVIYTCFHLDHISGIRAYASTEDVKSGNLEIFAHATLLANVVRQGRTIAPILGPRTAYNFGTILEDADIDGMNNGTGPLFRRDATLGFIAPTRTFSETLEVTIAGVALVLMHTPSEAADEIVVLLPASKILLSSEVIPAEHFPALHTLRGEAFRDPVRWYQSIDALRRLEVIAMVPAHGLPVIGHDKIDEIMRNYRDAIQFVHDQTVRHMNRGLTPDELIDVIKLPPHLANFKPWLQEFFGSVSQAARGIYQGYLGWFEGDPIALAPLPKAESARREVELMGGRDRLLAIANDALKDGDAQWAAELASRLVRISRDDMAARHLKAKAFRILGYAQINAIWRNWYLSAARELEGFDLTEYVRQNAAGFVTADLVEVLPARTFVEGLTTRLKSEDTADVIMTVGFEFPDVHEAYCLKIRRGVAQIEDQLPEQTDLMLRFDKAVLNRILLRQLTLRDAVLSKAIQVSQGSVLMVARFFGYFELPFSTPIRLAVR